MQPTLTSIMVESTTVGSADPRIGDKTAKPVGRTMAASPVSERALHLEVLRAERDAHSKISDHEWSRDGKDIIMEKSTIGRTIVAMM